MLEPVSFVLTVASTVLSRVIGDAISSRHKSVSRQELEKMVRAEIAANSPRTPPPPPVRIVEEVVYLARQLPGVSVSDREIRIEPVAPPRSPMSAQRRKVELSLRLKALDQIIEARRQQLAGADPTADMYHGPDSETDTVTGAGNETPTFFHFESPTSAPSASVAPSVRPGPSARPLAPTPQELRERLDSIDRDIDRRRTELEFPEGAE